MSLDAQRRAAFVEACRYRDRLSAEIEIDRAARAERHARSIERMVDFALVAILIGCAIAAL